MRLLSIFAGKVVTGIVLGSAFLVAHADPIKMRIISDGTWKSTNVFEQGWETTLFDDSGWVPARDPYPPPQQPIAGSTAHNIWYDPLSTSDGTTGSIEGFFRKSFTLDIQADSLPLVGQALISVDDDYEFFVNGNLALGNYDEGFANLVQFVDFTEFLQNGENVFAIHAVDGGWSQPHDRLFERVTFDANLRSVPEPGTLLLLSLGLVAFQLCHRKFCQKSLPPRASQRRLRKGDAVLIHTSVDRFWRVRLPSFFSHPSAPRQLRQNIYASN